jgi:hypothetical protein
MSTSPEQRDEVPRPPDRPRIGSNLLIIIYSALLMVVFCIIGFVPYTDTFIDAVKNMFQRPSLRSTPVETPIDETSSTAADKASACVVVWVENKSDDLGKKSRATVWEEKVSDRVKASGMTPHEFYDLVVEHNPQLIRDEYEFKKGKIYLLPECQ